MPASTRRLAIRFAVAATVVATAATAAASPASAATRTISMYDDYFVRSSNRVVLTVKRNTYTRWVNRGRDAHNVTVAVGPAKFRSGRMPARGRAYVKQVTKTGRYTIVCTIHPGMQVGLRVVR